MNDFRMPITGIPPSEGPEFGPSSYLDNQPGSGPQHPRMFWPEYNALPGTDPGGMLSPEGPDIQHDSAQIVARDGNLRNHFPKVRLWNPALRTAPSPFGDAMRGLFDPAVVQHLPIFRPTSPLRAAAGQANPFGAAGGGGSNESVRVPSASTVQAF
jgi:hypothetical protein